MLPGLTLSPLTSILLVSLSAHALTQILVLVLVCVRVCALVALFCLTNLASFAPLLAAFLPSSPSPAIFVSQEEV